MTKLEKEAEEKYCKGCKWRIEQCLWAWRKTNGLKEPNEKNCSCKEVPAYLAGAEPREKQIQIDAEQIRALQKQNGELTDKVKKLEAEVKEWKDKADLWCKTANLKDHNIMINKELEKENARLKEINTHTLSQLNLDNGELIIENEKLKKENAELRNNGFTVSAMTEQQLKVALEKGEQLEKENAELKEKVNILDNCDRLGDVITEAYKEQLTNAKEIIREFVEWATWQGSNCPSFKSIQDKAEQFLKDSEVEK